MRREWPDLQRRLVSGAVLAAAAFFCLWSGGWIYDLFVLLGMAGLVWEGETLIGQNCRSWRGALLLLWPVAAGLAALKGDGVASLLTVLAALCFGLRAWLPVLVAAAGGMSLLWLRSQPSGMILVLYVLAVVVASDSTAYLVGSLIGGPKLAPSISPGKTWSGALGGLLGASAAGVLVAQASGLGAGPGSFPWGALVWGAVLGMSAQCGDLLESAVKRRCGVKDSGTLIPGHGGLLDRFDGLLAASPLAALATLLASGRVFWAADPSDLWAHGMGWISLHGSISR